LPNITKKELIDRIADTHQIRARTTRLVVQSFLDEIVNELANGNRLEFRDFGVFETKFRAAREAQNPKTLEKVHVPARHNVKFKMGQMMKLKLNTPKQDLGVPLAVASIGNF
jgi:integration host factor subunit beta